MSSDLTWLLIRNNSSFLYKKDGYEFSAEAGNLVNKNSYKYSGLANTKTIHIQETAKGCTLIKNGKKIKQVSIPLTRGGARRASKSAASIAKNGHYRPDLAKAAAARAGLLLLAKAKKTSVVNRATKLRGNKAVKQN